MPAYVTGGMYELPNDWFNVTDDNVNEIEQSFAVMAEVGADVPDGISCFQTQDRETNCHGRSGTTEIRIEDNDRKLHAYIYFNGALPWNRFSLQPWLLGLDTGG